MAVRINPNSGETREAVRITYPRKALAVWMVWVTAALLLAIVAPVVVRGGLLADEYIICERPIHEGGYTAYLQEIWRDTGVVRPARFIELFLISESCTTIHYGFVILVPLVLKLAAAVLLAKVLRRMDLPTPWPEIGAVLWLLEPVGTEAALWPAALHVPLGLVLGLAAIRTFQDGRFVLAGLASLGAALSVEQVIFALPLAVWLTCPRDHRRRAAVVAGVMMMIVLAAYATWPGQNERQALTLGERWQQLMAKRAWYVFFPAAGLGLYSGAIGFQWAFPYSTAVAAVFVLAGWWMAPRLLEGHTVPPLRAANTIESGAAAGLLLVLINLPLIVTEVGYSARTFTPTWLALSGAIPWMAARVRWRRLRIVGVIAGTFAGFAILSLTFSVFVRLRTDTFNRAAAQWIADRTQNGSVVAVCDVARTVVDPAPLGAFHLHELHSIWPHWIEYHTGRVVEIRRSSERYWGSRCPDLTGADLVIQFPELTAALATHGRRPAVRRP
jgi:hypothetical protein